MDSNKEGLQREEIILKAARKVFRQKGYDASTVRDIADEAGVNHALINYYYHNKQNLLRCVLRDDLYTHLKGLATIVNNSALTWEGKIQAIIDYYTDYLIHDPDSQRFFFNEVGLDDDFLSKDSGLSKMVRGSLLEQELMALGLTSEQTIHLVINAISLILGPIMTAPLMKVFCSLDEQTYLYMVSERRHNILPWLKAMYGIH